MATLSKELPLKKASLAAPSLAPIGNMLDPQPSQTNCYGAEALARIERTPSKHWEVEPTLHQAAKMVGIHLKLPQYKLAEQFFRCWLAVNADEAINQLLPAEFKDIEKFQLPPEAYEQIDALLIKLCRTLLMLALEKPLKG